MIIPSTRVFTAGEIETGAYLNATVTNLGNFLLGKPVFSAYQSTVQSIPNNVYTALTFTSEIVDRDNGHSNTVNTGRYTANTAGYYLFNGVAQFAANVTGYRAVLWHVNGAFPTTGNYTQTSSTLSAGVIASVTAVPFLQYLAVGDYVDLRVLQTSGAALNTVVTSGIASSMTAIWVSV